MEVSESDINTGYGVSVIKAEDSYPIGKLQAKL